MDINEYLDYNTGRERLAMPEYGRNVLKMVEQLKAIPDREKRSEQARAVIKVMEQLNPAVRTQENYEQKLWDHLYIISGFDLDVDSPYPSPIAADFETKPVPIPMKGDKIKAAHYGRNIEKIMDLICEQSEGELRDYLTVQLATYMRQQYLIWNKDSVEDATIFSDIEKLSEGRIKVPEGLSLEKLSAGTSFSRPTLMMGQEGSSKNKNRKGGRGKQNRRH